VPRTLRPHVAHTSRTRRPTSPCEAPGLRGDFRPSTGHKPPRTSTRMPKARRTRAAVARRPPEPPWPAAQTPPVRARRPSTGVIRPRHGARSAPTPSRSRAHGSPGTGPCRAGQRAKGRREEVEKGLYKHRARTHVRSRAAACGLARFLSTGLPTLETARFPNNLKLAPGRLPGRHNIVNFASCQRPFATAFRSPPPPDTASSTASHITLSA
jgi:hypothetical protein